MKRKREGEKLFVDGKQCWNKFVITTDKDSKLKDFLIDELNFSVRSISKMKRDKNIFVNGENRKPTGYITKGDLVEIIIDEEGSDFLSQDLKVEYLYEDFDLLIANKPPFMVVHPTKSHYEGTLANDVKHHIGKVNENYKIRFANRLDMNTSGIVVIAKNAYSHHKISCEMSENNTEKIYIAVVEGIVPNDSGTIDLPIYRDSEENITRCVDYRGQRSITHYEVLERMKEATVLRLKLETGRTHQIRVHLSHIGHGIYGDELYGKVDETLINRQALHAYKMSITQPRLNTRVSIISPIPNDILELIQKLGGTSDFLNL